MRVAPVRPGLWTWTGVHPELGGEVSCVYYEGRDEVVLVDPLVPPEDEERFLRALDRDVERLGRPVAVVLTCAWHRRSADVLAGRYGGRVGGALPSGVEAFPLGQDEESALWLAEHGALVVGDALAGTPLRLAPGRDPGPLRFLLGLPVEVVLPAHGEPVTDSAPAALARALSAPDEAAPATSGV